MEDLNSLFARFIEVNTATFNRYFLPKGEAAMDSYGAVERAIFQAIVLDPLNLKGEYGSGDVGVFCTAKSGAVGALQDTGARAALGGVTLRFVTFIDQAYEPMRMDYVLASTCCSEVGRSGGGDVVLGLSSIEKFFV